MRNAPLTYTTVLLGLFGAAGLCAQETPLNKTAVAPVPRLVRWNSSFRPTNGQPVAAIESVTLSIYRDQQDSTPLWSEMQNVTVDAEGRYTLLIGSTLPDGVPADLFASGEPRWLGVQFNRPGEAEQARVLLASVPYALKAADADTLGGLPASAYLRNPSATVPGAPSAAGTTGASARASAMAATPRASSGTANFLGMFTNSTDLGNSVLYQSGSTIGLNTTSPYDYFHVRFSDGSGSVTGYAVQNLSSSANAYSGMLFYDQNGALGQFQGFNNTTHEYRINNASSGGSINFMIGSSSKFLVAKTGDIDIGTGNLGIGTTTGLARLTVRGKASFTATGTATTDGSGTVTGTGTQFLSEIGLGDRIQVPSGTGSIYTVNAILSDTSLTVAGLFPAGTGQSIGVLPSLFRVDTSSGNTGFRVTNEGNVQIGGNFSVSGSNPKVFATAVDPFTGTSATYPSSGSGENFGTIVLRDSTTATADVGTMLGFSGQPGGVNGIYAGVRGAKENSTSSDFSGYLGFYTTQNGSPNTFAERMRVSSTGNVGIGITTPNARLQVAAGDVYVSSPGSGMILKSPDGTKCARISLDNTGALVTTSLACP